MKQIALSISLAAVLALPMPVLAREPDKPVTANDPSARDIAETPIEDLNLKKGHIPPVLVSAVQRPYGLTGLGNCAQLAAAIGELNAVLGDDVDLPQAGGGRTSAGRIAQSVATSFIPFRGVIREVTGASARKRELEEAVLAGVARRAFLKGAGEARGCAYPARSVTPRVFAERMAELNAKAAKADAKDSRPPASPGAPKRH
jgi:hypothetical protein